MAIGASSLGGRSVEWFKGSFFDGGAVLKQMDKTTRRVFSRFGALVRRRAQTSIRYGTNPSPPGQPPTGHKTFTRLKKKKQRGVVTLQKQGASPLRDLIFFAYSAESQSVVTGPALFAGSKQTRTGSQTIPEALEKGGQATVLEALSGGHWYLIHSLELLQRITKPTRKRQARIDRRAFMAPALAAELPGLVPMYDKSF